MSTVPGAAIENLQDRSSRLVEDCLKPWFPDTKAYRYNSASIRIRVIDPSFEGLSRERRVDEIEPHLDALPVEIQQDIIFLLALAPSDLERSSAASRDFLRNIEFENPSPSDL